MGTLTEHAASTGTTDGRPWWRPRWWEMAPEAGLAVALAVFLLQETDAATSAFKSGRAVALMALGAVLWVAGRVLLARLVPWPLLRAGVFAVAALAVLGVVVLPAYDDDTVIETYPQAAAGTARPASPSTVAAPASPSTVAAPASPSTVGRPASPSTVAAPATPSTVAAPQPVQLRAGSFRGVDHRASGTVSLYRHPDGRYVVGLENFDIQPGPDYDLYVVPGAGREDRSGGTRLDDLRGNRGTQFDDVPSGLDLGRGPWSVLVWCQTFGVPVATATLS